MHGCAGETLKSLNNACHARVLLRCIQCTTYTVLPLPPTYVPQLMLMTHVHHYITWKVTGHFLKFNVQWVDPPPSRMGKILVGGGLAQWTEGVEPPPNPPGNSHPETIIGCRPTLVSYCQYIGGITTPLCRWHTYRKLLQDACRPTSYSGAGFKYVEALGKRPLPTLKCYNLHAFTTVIITKYIYIFVEAP